MEKLLRILLLCLLVGIISASKLDIYNLNVSILIEGQWHLLIFMPQNGCKYLQHVHPADTRAHDVYI